MRTAASTLLIELLLSKPEGAHSDNDLEGLGGPEGFEHDDPVRPTLHGATRPSLKLIGSELEETPTRRQLVAVLASDVRPNLVVSEVGDVFGHGSGRTCLRWLGVTRDISGSDRGRV
jgi:hypothetical protein